MTLKQILFSFSGRIPRKTSWLATLGVWVMIFVYIMVVGGIQVAAGMVPKPGEQPPLVINLLGLCFFEDRAGVGLYIVPSTGAVGAHAGGGVGGSTGDRGANTGPVVY